MSQLKKNAINMVSGGAGYFLPMAINFLATPLLLEKLGKEAFGLQSLVNVILGYLMVADMNLDVPIIKYLSEYSAKRDQLSINKLLNTTLQLYTGLGFLGMVILFLVEPYMHEIFSIPIALQPEASLVFWITGVGFLGNIICMWGKAVFIGIQRYEIANGIYISFNTLASIIGIILVYNGLGVAYFVLAKVVGFFLSAVSYFISGNYLLANYKFSFGFDKATLINIRPLIGYGFLMRFSSLIFSRLDQTFIGTWVGIGAVGIYSIPLLLTTSLVGLISGIMNYTFPRASELFSTDRVDDLKNLFRSSTKYVTIIASFFFGFIIIAGDRFIYIWVGNDIATTTSAAIVILSIASLIQIMTASITNNFVVAMNGMGFFTKYSVLRGLTMAAGFLLLIRPLGINGAALGILLANSCDIIYLIISLRKYIDLKFKDLAWISFGKPVVIAMLCGTLVYLVKPFIVDWISLILVGLGYSLIFVLLVIISSVFNQEERQVIMKVLKRIMPFNF